MHDEGDAAIELVEPCGLHEGALCRLFGQVAGELSADHGKQVEIFPIELPIYDGPRKQHSALQTVEMT